jgi:hypothetical protein
MISSSFRNKVESTPRLRVLVQTYAETAPRSSASGDAWKALRSQFPTATSADCIEVAVELGLHVHVARQRAALEEKARGHDIVAAGLEKRGAMAGASQERHRAAQIRAKLAGAGETTDHG